MKKRKTIFICFVSLVLFSIAFGGIADAQNASISVSPSTVNVSHGGTFTVNITVAPAGNEIYGAQYDLYFNQNIVNATAQTRGTFLSQDGTSTIVVANTINNTTGRIEYGETRMGVDYGVTTSGTLASITFKAVAPGTSTLNLSNVVLSDPNTSIATDARNGSVLVVLTQKPDLILSGIKPYHYSTQGVWFNLTNFVNISVVNEGEPCNRFNVTLNIEGIEFKKEVQGLGTGEQANVIFNWTPIGKDCMKGGSSKGYTINASVDSDNKIEEVNETNNNASATTTVYWNGYMADEPLDNVARGKIRGGLYYTTGDSYYSGVVAPGKSASALYNITLPPDAKVQLARLNVYYTWANAYPEMQVNITTPEGTTHHDVPLERSYNDRKCSPGYNLLWGNYVFNLTPYINESGIYNVTVRELSSGRPCYAGRGIAIVYEDDTMPLREFWINEGADILIGGRRADGGGLSLEESTNNAPFPGSIDLNTVTNATLAVVSPWSDNPWEAERNVLFFNDIELGRSVYTGYQPIGDISLNGIRMTGSGYPQVGVNLSNVISYLNANINIAGQGDNGDNMMPSNAFLMVEYKEVFDTGPGTYPSIFGIHNGTIKPNRTITVNRIYTYPSTGTGGHTEYARIWGNGVDAHANWSGYAGDWHNLPFNNTFTLEKGKDYNYTIRTGSYPQIIHAKEFNAAGGTINCDKFIDANGRVYHDWIPAFRLY